MSIKNKKILFTYPSPVSFIDKDLDIIKKNYEVIPYKYQNVKDIIGLVKGIIKSDAVFSWFIDDWNAFISVILAKLFFKRSIMLVGGGDVANIPEIGYGGALNKHRRRRIKLTMKLANKLIAVSNHTKSEAMKIHPREDICVVYHGFDSTMFAPSSEKNGSVITIGNVSRSNLNRKGIEAFVKAASYLPDTNFIVIGSFKDDSVDMLKDIKTDNVTLTGRVSDDDLLQYMSKANVYVQVSKHEGFGCSMAEAMLCECAVVVTKEGAIPEVVGDIGYYVNINSPQETAEAISLAICNEASNKQSRKRIVELFPLSKREERLIKCIEEALS